MKYKISTTEYYLIKIRDWWYDIASRTVWERQSTNFEQQEYVYIVKMLWKREPKHHFKSMFF